MHELEYQPGKSIVTKSRVLARVFRDVEKVLGPSCIAVLIHGETGTGKEGVARGLHFHSPRRDRPFVAINCACIPEDLAESELFGYVRGAFTGAAGEKKGLFEGADGGTIFLDELDKLSLQNQGRLLRVLQDGVVNRLGATSGKKVDVRVVAACKKEPLGLIRDGVLLEDLYYRLAGEVVQLPTLAARPEDVPALAAYFCKRLAGERRCRIKGISSRVMRMLRTWPWPGNVRELENVIGSAVARRSVRGGRASLQEADLPASFRLSWCLTNAKGCSAGGDRPATSATTTAQPYEVRTLESAILLALAVESPLAVPELARRVGREKSSVHRRVKAMENRGLVRISHRKGRGGTLVYLPPGGGNVTNLGRQNDVGSMSGGCR